LFSDEFLVDSLQVTMHEGKCAQPSEYGIPQSISTIEGHPSNKSAIGLEIKLTMPESRHFREKAIPGPFPNVNGIANQRAYCNGISEVLCWTACSVETDENQYFK
jgi:hypothetical protein